MWNPYQHISLASLLNVCHTTSTNCETAGALSSTSLTELTHMQTASGSSHTPPHTFITDQKDATRTQVLVLVGPPQISNWLRCNPWKCLGGFIICQKLLILTCISRLVKCFKFTVCLRSQPKVAAWGHSLRSQPEVTAWGHSLRSQLEVAAWGHSLRSQPEVAACGRSLRSQPEVTAWGRSLRSQPEVTAWGHSLRSQPEVTAWGRSLRSQSDDRLELKDFKAAI